MLNNRIDSTELIRIADAVADEKSISKDLVLTSMESAIEKAARTRYGTENEIYYFLLIKTMLNRNFQTNAVKSKISVCYKATLTVKMDVALRI